MIEVVNRQRRFAVDAMRWQRFAEDALRAVQRVDKSVDKRASATIGFVGDAAIRSLNRDFRARDSVTDVLSFPAEPEEFEQRAEGESERFLGDIVISLAQAERQAAEHGLDFDTEVAQLILHGLLHLCGYDHANDGGEMNGVELRLRARLGI